MDIFAWFRREAPAFVPNEPGDDPAAFTLPPKPVQKHQTAADALDFWTRKHKATYTIDRTPDNVRVSVALPDGTVLTGNMPSTATAVAAVVDKLRVL